jgi:hypothetical protein
MRNKQASISVLGPANCLAVPARAIGACWGGMKPVDFQPQNAFAPVLGGGRFTQPGADGGERLTHRKIGTRPYWCSG